MIVFGCIIISALLLVTLGWMILRKRNERREEKHRKREADIIAGSEPEMIGNGDGTDVNA